MSSSTSSLCFPSHSRSCFLSSCVRDMLLGWLLAHVTITNIIIIIIRRGGGRYEGVSGPPSIHHEFHSAEYGSNSAPGSADHPSTPPFLRHDRQAAGVGSRTTPVLRRRRATRAPAPCRPGLSGQSAAEGIIQHRPRATGRPLAPPAAGFAAIACYAWPVVRRFLP